MARHNASDVSWRKEGTDKSSPVQSSSLFCTLLWRCLLLCSVYVVSQLSHNKTSEHSRKLSIDSTMAKRGVEGRRKPDRQQNENRHDNNEQKHHKQKLSPPIPSLLGLLSMQQQREGLGWHAISTRRRYIWQLRVRRKRQGKRKRNEGHCEQKYWKVQKKTRRKGGRDLSSLLFVRLLNSIRFDEAKQQLTDDRYSWRIGPASR